MKKIKKSFEKGVDICVVMVYNVVTKLKKEVNKMIKTNELKKAVIELAKEHDAQYAEDCVKAFLKQRKINFEQYLEMMNVLYN